MKQKNIEPEVEMRLYGVIADGLNYDFFDNVDELFAFCRKNMASTKSLIILDYIREFAGRTDVIRMQTSGFLSIYSQINDNSVAVYNNKKSDYQGKYVWEYELKNIDEFYNEFRNRGIVLEEDTNVLNKRKIIKI